MFAPLPPSNYMYQMAPKPFPGLPNKLQLQPQISSHTPVLTYNHPPLLMPSPSQSVPNDPFDRVVMPKQSKMMRMRSQSSIIPNQQEEP